MTTTTLTIRMDSTEKELLSKYAEVHGVTTSEFARKSILEKIEDDLDLKKWRASKNEYANDPQTLSATEIARKYL